jgi:hypothetical protein
VVSASGLIRPILRPLMEEFFARPETSKSATPKVSGQEAQIL